MRLRWELKFLARGLRPQFYGEKRGQGLRKKCLRPYVKKGQNRSENECFKPFFKVSIGKKG